MSNNVKLRWSTKADQPALLALFERAFGAPMSPALWAWKYPPNAWQSMLAEQDGQVVAHYGGQPRRLQGAGNALHALQISDIMVDPKARGVLTRHGVFSQIARHFTDQVVKPQGEFDFVYGFPAPRASRLGERLGMYAPLDQLLQLGWHPTHGNHARPALQSVTLASLAPLGDRLWAQQRTLSEQHLMSIRDQAWLEQRYLTHPVNEYSALVKRSRWRRVPQAAVVYKVHDDALEIVDFLGCPEDYSALVQGVCQQAAHVGKTSVFGWLTPAVEALLPAPMQREMLLPVNIAGQNKEQWQTRFQGSAWMTAGDTDYR